MGRKNCIDRGVHVVTADADNVAAMEIRFSGASGPRGIRAEEPLPGVINRYLGSDPSKWRAGISTFGRILEQVYPGIDGVFYGNGLELEYDIEVAEGVSSDCASIDFPGAELVQIDSEGALLLKLGNVTLLQRAPLVYQRGALLERRQRAPVGSDASSRASVAVDTNGVAHPAGGYISGFQWMPGLRLQVAGVPFGHQTLRRRIGDQ